MVYWVLVVNILTLGGLAKNNRNVTAKPRNAYSIKAPLYVPVMSKITPDKTDPIAWPSAKNGSVNPLIAPRDVLPK